MGKQLCWEKVGVTKRSQLKRERKKRKEGEYGPTLPTHADSKILNKILVNQFYSVKYI